MTTRFVLDYQKHVNNILEALRTHGPTIISAVREETVAPTTPRGVDCEPLIKHACDTVQSRLEALIEADRVHQDELADDGLPRAARDDAALALNQCVVQLKKSAHSLFGDTWVKRLNFPATVPYDPTQIEAVGAQLLRTLAKTALPQSQVPGVGAVDKGAWFDAIQAPYARLVAARADVLREEHEARVTLGARDGAIDALIGAAVTAVQLTQALARLGKVAHLVEGLRGTLPTSASSASSSDEEKAGPEATPAAPVTPA